MRVETRSGTVEGIARGAHAAFLGIPFAKPPVGPLRFCAPEPPEPWAGVRAADQFGPAAMQGLSFAAGVDAEEVQSEDCLYLNVFTRGAGDRRFP